MIIERPNQTTLLIEIKSTHDVTRPMLKSLDRLKKNIPHSEALCLLNDHYAKQFDEIWVLPWQQGLKKIFEDSQFDRLLTT